MRQRSLTLAIALMVAVGAASLPLRASAAVGDPWIAESSLVSGMGEYVAGEWIYTDFVYDDYGADTIPSGQPNHVSLAPTSGDFRYPSAAKYGANAADIVEVRLRPVAESDDLDVRVVLQTVIDPTVVALWVSVNGTESVITHANSTVDAAANTVSFVLADAVVDSTTALNLGAGLHDGNGGLMAGTAGNANFSPGSFTTGGPTSARLFDLAFNTHQLEGRGGAWNEDKQSDILAAGDLAPLAQTIHVDILRHPENYNLVSLAPAGYYVRLFESRQNLGEGVASSFPEFRGRWQPYAVWISPGYNPSEPAPLFLSLHSLEVHHNQYRGGSAPSASYASYYEEFGNPLGAIVVTPLGRGPDGWYEDEGLVDTLEVWADALAHFSIDRERVYVGGYSMGGYGTYRLTTLMPDAFAAAVSVVGPPANGIWAYPLAPTGGEANPDNTRRQLENTRHIPFWITHGVADELVPVSGVVHQTNRFRELGHEYRFALHPAADHLSFAFQDEWSRESAWLAAHPTRVTNPHQVTLKVRPASWATGANAVIRAHIADLVGEVGARVDGAYWVDDVTPAGTGDATGLVDLASGGIGRREATTTPVAEPGVDGPSPHALTGLDVGHANFATTDTLTGQLSGVSALTVDVGRAGLSDSPSLSVTTNTPVTLTLVRDGVVVGTHSL